MDVWNISGVFEPALTIICGSLATLWPLAVFIREGRPLDPRKRRIAEEHLPRRIARATANPYEMPSNTMSVTMSQQENDASKVDCLASIEAGPPIEIESIIGLVNPSDRCRHEGSHDIYRYGLATSYDSKHKTTLSQTRGVRMHSSFLISRFLSIRVGNDFGQCIVTATNVLSINIRASKLSFV